MTAKNKECASKARRPTSPQMAIKVKPEDVHPERILEVKVPDFKRRRRK